MLPNNQSDFKPTQAQIQAADAVLEAMGNLNEVAPVVKAYQTAVLQARQFPVGPKWIERGEPQRVVLDVFETHLLSEADADLFYALLDVEFRKAGFDIPEGCCPALVAETALRTASHTLLDVMTPHLGFSRDDIFEAPNAVENYEKAVGICLALLRPFCLTPYRQLAKAVLSKRVAE